MARCGWMDGASSPVTGKAWEEDARELEQKRTAAKIQREQGSDEAVAREKQKKQKAVSKPKITMKSRG